MSRAVRFLSAFLALWVSGVAAAQDETAVASAEGAAAARPEDRGDPTRSVSVGLTSAGSLAHATELSDGDAWFVKHGSTDTRWGTAEVVAMVESAATAVAEAFPESRLTVGDISRRHGGRTHPHSSHRAGRDVDIGFYLRDGETGDRVVADRFINLNRGGRGRDQHGRRYRFDAERNWALMVAILNDDRVDVQFVLVNGFIRRMLIQHARGAGADAELLERFQEVSAGRSGSASHTSHFHVRIYCSPHDRPRCIDAPPFHPWVFTTEDEIEKRLAEWRELTPPRRVRARRARRRASMQRHASRSRMTRMGMAMASGMERPAMASPMTTQVASRAP
jgi:penicillin-insensitive murein endopeptidase